MDGFPPNLFFFLLLTFPRFNEDEVTIYPWNNRGCGLNNYRQCANFVLLFFSKLTFLCAGIACKNGGTVMKTCSNWLQTVNYEVPKDARCPDDATYSSAPQTWWCEGGVTRFRCCSYAAHC